MAKLALLLAAAVAGIGAIPAHPAPAPQASAVPPIPVTIQQFEQFLSASNPRRDSKLAGQLAGFELTERAGSARFAHWLKQIPGKRSRQALIPFADLSAFEDLPAADLPPDPTPDLETQRAIFARIVDYVVRTRPKLPNFSALRSTTRFEIATPAQIRTEEEVARTFTMGREKTAYLALGRARPGSGGGQWLFFTASSSRRVTYRDGREISANGSDSSLSDSLLPRLSSIGEFGPILSVVVGDAVHGKVAWSHWEPGVEKPLAVFRYSVPQAASHYAVADSPTGDSTFPAYHGEIAVDSDTGAIFRITLLAERNSTQMSESGIVVEYGPVSIAGKSYTCPIHSIALSRAALGQGNGAPYTPDLARTFLNDVSFTDYHVFRTEMRILP